MITNAPKYQTDLYVKTHYFISTKSGINKYIQENISVQLFWTIGKIEYHYGRCNRNFIWWEIKSITIQLNSFLRGGRLDWMALTQINAIEFWLIRTCTDAWWLFYIYATVTGFGLIIPSVWVRSYTDPRNNPIHKQQKWPATIFSFLSLWLQSFMGRMRQQLPLRWTWQHTTS